MKKYSFLDDYSEGCHPQILEALASTNLQQQTAYGNDDFSEQARTAIRGHMNDQDLPVHFVAGGTLANLTIIASALRPHEAVIAASTGHIVVRETGAIEATGHKILTVPSVDGKLTTADIEATVSSNAHFPHMAKPRLVYISNTTETGTVYTKAELEAMSDMCKANKLLLLLDGARLGAALSSRLGDTSLRDIAELTDIFWIGGTKTGALFGEAIVIPNRALAEDFLFHVKQRGALLAKGRLLGIQFKELFSNDLFFKLADRANTLARKLSQGLTDAGYSLDAPTESNQIFPVLPDNVITTLQNNFDFYIWRKVDAQNSVVRMVTSWATEESQVDRFISDLHGC